MKLTTEQAHSPETKKGVNRCSRCKKQDPDLTEPCPKGKISPAPSGLGDK